MGGILGLSWGDQSEPTEFVPGEMETGIRFSPTLTSTLKKTREKHRRYVQMCKNAGWVTHIPICGKYLRETDETTNESPGDLREQEDEVTLKSLCSNRKGAISLLLPVSPEPAAPFHILLVRGRTRSVSKSLCVLSLLPFYVDHFVFVVVSSFSCSLTWVGSSPCSYCWSPA